MVTGWPGLATVPGWFGRGRDQRETSPPPHPRLWLAGLASCSSPPSCPPSPPVDSKKLEISFREIDR